MSKTALFAMMFWTTSAFCQTTGKEPDTLQALLAEVHQLRQDIEGMTVASQRVQIALYALQMQDAAVARSGQRMDSARSKCTVAEEGRQSTAGQIQRIESFPVSATVPQNETEAAKEHLAGLKTLLEMQVAQVQACRADEAEAATQLRNDRAKLLELQDRITRLDKALEQLGGTGK